MLRNDPWTMSSRRAVHEALSLGYLARERLESLLIIWQTLTAKNPNRPVRIRMPGGVGGTQPRGRLLSRSLLCLDIAK